MSTLNGSSSLAQVEVSYGDNCSYVEDNDPIKARAFITACRLLIRLYPRMISSGQQHTHLNPDLLQQEVQAAQDWLASNDTTTQRVTRVSFEQFKEY